MTYILISVLIKLLCIATNLEGKRMDIDSMIILNVSGSHYEMGVEYGTLLKYELNQSLHILLNHLINKDGMTYQQVVEQSQLFSDRYSYSYNFFISGISDGSGLSLTDCKILNAMETIHKSDEDSMHMRPFCSYVSLPPIITENNATLIGRNYDYGSPFAEIARYLTVTVINENEKVPTAIIALPGQIYCPSCINKEGIFIELNNGGPSGGFEVNQNRQTMLIKLLETLQNSDSINDVIKQMNSFESDYSLIINTNDLESDGQSFEYSSTLGMKPYFFSKNQSFVSTNYYLNDTWTGIPPPSDITTWDGVTRRNNLIDLTSKSNSYNIQDLIEIMNLKTADGGALSLGTIYQIVFDTRTFALYLTHRYQEKWTYIPLNDFW